MLSYYQNVLPLIAASFEATPVVWDTFPNGTDVPIYHGILRDRVHELPTVHVPGTNGSSHTYLSLSSRTLAWLCEYHHAVEFLSWTPVANKPRALRYARILLDGTAASAAALHARDLLKEYHLQAIPLLDGNGGIAMFVPFDDEPDYAVVRHWLHAFANDAAARFPDLFTTEPNSHGGQRVHIHVANNAPGRYSALPYSLRGPEGRYAVAPVTWSEIEQTVDSCPRFAASDVLSRIAERGDLFASMRANIPSQRFCAIPVSQPTILAADAQPRGHVLKAALDILSDGRARSAQDILTDGIKRGLLPASTSYRYVYNALVEYMNRNAARSRKSAIMQNPDRTFRINEPLDDWPAVNMPAAPSPDDATLALMQRLRMTASGADPAAWEVAVCDAFAHMGFRSTHLGGQKAPDGYLDAQLGPLGYRVMLECKTGAGIVPHPDVPEAAKWAEQYNAQYKMIVGPGFPSEVEFHNELLVHGVSAWTLDDILTGLEQRLDPCEMRACFEPGFAQDAMLDVLWERIHGEHKRATYAAITIHSQGWEAQVAAASQADPANAAHVTLDAAMLLVQDELTRSQSSRACTRAEIQLAFEYLTNPIIGHAVWLDDARTAIVLRHGP